jgi:hypothetical protein
MYGCYTGNKSKKTHMGRLNTNFRSVVTFLEGEERVREGYREGFHFYP